jgi:hypothetical protein
VSLYDLGRWDEARVIFEQMAAVETTDVGFRFLATIAAVHQGDRAAAAAFARWLSDAEARGPLVSQLTTVTPDYFRAHLAVVMGDTAAALRHLRALRAASPTDLILGIHSESDWQALRDDPRVQALLRPVGENFR